MSGPSSQPSSDGLVAPAIRQDPTHGVKKSHIGYIGFYYSQLPRAQTGELRIGEPGLYKRRLDLNGELSGHKVFARAIGPDRLEICTAVSSAAIADGQAENTRTLTLE